MSGEQKKPYALKDLVQATKGNVKKKSTFRDSKLTNHAQSKHMNLEAAFKRLAAKRKAITQISDVPLKQPKIVPTGQIITKTTVATENDRQLKKRSKNEVSLDQVDVKKKNVKPSLFNEGLNTSNADFDLFEYQLSDDLVDLTDNATDVLENSQLVENFDEGSKINKNETKSTIWYFFDKCKTEKGIINAIKCKFCKIKYSYQVGGQTSTALRHLKKYHKADYEKHEKQKPSDSEQPSLSDCLKNMKKKSLLILSNHQRQMFTWKIPVRTFEEKLVRYAIKSNISYITFDSPAFKELFLSTPGVDPNLIIPSSWTVKRKVHRLFDEVRTDLMNCIRENSSKMSLTTNCWTSPFNESYMSINMQFIDEQWKIQHFLLDFVSLTGSHAGSNIASVFETAVFTDEGFGLLSNRVLGLTTGNASNNDTFVDSMVDKKLMNSNQHINCFAHVLDLAAQDYIAEIAPLELMSKIRTVVKWFTTQSPQRMERLQNMCNDKNIKFLHPIIDVKTRWNSTYHMLERMVELKDVIKYFLAIEEIPYQKGHAEQIDKADEILRITSIEWDRIHQIIKFLRPFEEITQRVSGHNYVTASFIIPSYDALLKNIKAIKFELEKLRYPKESPTVFEKAVIQAELKMNRYYKKVSDILLIATLLDPRFNLMYFTEKPEIYEEAKINQLKSLFQKAFVDGSYGILPENNVETSELTCDSSSIFSSMFEKKIPEDEIKQYFSMQRISERDDPLIFWRDNGQMFPALRKMAKDYLAIAGTSVMSEGTFSEGRNLLLYNRSRTSSETVREVLCLRSWFKLNMLTEIQQDQEENYDRNQVQEW